MNKLTLRDIDLAGKKVFMRVDFNVPLKEGKVKDATRITETLPSIQYALEHGARLILGSHLGRPKGERNPEMSLAPVATVLETLLKRKVQFVPDCIGAEVAAAADALAPGEVLLLENLRYYKAEEKNDPDFAAKLAAIADVYVNDAFGTAHRAHASTEGMTRHIATRAAGFLMEKELTYLGKALGEPDRPFVAILGGAKVSDKIEVIQNLLPRVDSLLIGGGMAYTFLKAQGLETGKSLVEEDKLDLARELLRKAREGGVELLLPIDHLIADAFAPEARVQTKPVAEPVPEGWMGLDIGPASSDLFTGRIAKARTIVWNGPMGVFEMPPFAGGTMAVARAVAGSQAVSIIGGGDSVAAVNQAGVSRQITHISSGGGASLEFLGGLDLPGVAALQDKA